MKNSAEVLTDLLKHLKISANKLAAEIGLKANTAIYHVKNGRNNISSELANKITARFPEINYNWLLTGEGDMLKNEEEPATGVQDPNEKYENASLQRVQQDLQALAAGMTKNFEVLSDAMIESLKGQQKILKFIEQLDAKEISEATSKLERILKEKESNQ